MQQQNAKATKFRTCSVSDKLHMYCMMSTADARDACLRRREKLSTDPCQAAIIWVRSSTSDRGLFNVISAGV